MPEEKTKTEEEKVAKKEVEKKEEKPEEKQEEKKEEVKEEKETKEVKEEEKPKEPEKKKEEKKPKKKVKVPKKFEKLVKEIEGLKVSDLAELVKILEEKFGVSAVPQALAPAPGATPAATAAPEKQVFNIELTAVGEKKIEVIKIVRDVVGKGLKEAKDLVDAVTSGPQKLKENAKKEEAEEIKKTLEATGATVELK